MTQARYKWKEKSAVKLPAQVVGEELERLRVAHNGRLTNEMVIAAAQPRTSPLHKAFEWRDSVAGKQFRLSQAAYLIRSIEVVVTVSKNESRKVRAFVSVKRDKDRSYTTLAHAMTDKELRDQVVTQAWSELRAWQQKYETLRELAKVRTAIERLMPAE